MPVDCPTCGAPDGYPPAGPCGDSYHAAEQSQELREMVRKLDAASDWDRAVPTFCQWAEKFADDLADRERVLVEAIRKALNELGVPGPDYRERTQAAERKLARLREAARKIASMANRPGQEEICAVAVQAVSGLTEEEDIAINDPNYGGFTLDTADGSTWHCDECGVELGLKHKAGCPRTPRLALRSLRGSGLQGNRR